MYTQQRSKNGKEKGKPHLRKTALLNLTPKNFKAGKDAAREAAKMGVPAFIKMTLMPTGGIVTGSAAKAFGTAALAGIAIAGKPNRLAEAFFMGFPEIQSPHPAF